MDKIHRARLNVNMWQPDGLFCILSETDTAIKLPNGKFPYFATDFPGCGGKCKLTFSTLLWLLNKVEGGGLGSFWGGSDRRLCMLRVCVLPVKERMNRNWSVLVWMDGFCRLRQKTFSSSLMCSLSPSVNPAPLYAERAAAHSLAAVPYVHFCHLISCWCCLTGGGDSKLVFAYGIVSSRSRYKQCKYIQIYDTASSVTLTLKGTIAKTDK